MEDLDALCQCPLIKVSSFVQKMQLCWSWCPRSEQPRIRHSLALPRQLFRNGRPLRRRAAAAALCEALAAPQVLKGPRTLGRDYEVRKPLFPRKGMCQYVQEDDDGFKLYMA